MRSIVEMFRASSEAPILYEILCEKMGVTQEVIKRDHNGSASDYDTAILTVLRFIFGMEIMSTDIIIDSTAKRRALLWLRRQKIGREIKNRIENIIIETRYTYETTVANESIRLLLQSYKKAESILYEEEIEVLYDCHS